MYCTDYTAVDCGTPPTITNGAPGTPDMTTLGVTVTYSCDSGYEISTGLSTIACLNTGMWDTPPTCAGNPESSDVVPVNTISIGHDIQYKLYW